MVRDENDDDDDHDTTTTTTTTTITTATTTTTTTSAVDNDVAVVACAFEGATKSRSIKSVVTRTNKNELHQTSLFAASSPPLVAEDARA